MITRTRFRLPWMLLAILLAVGCGGGGSSSLSPGPGGPGDGGPGDGGPGDGGSGGPSPTGYSISGAATVDGYGAAEFELSGPAGESPVVTWPVEPKEAALLAPSPNTSIVRLQFAGLAAERTVTLKAAKVVNSKETTLS